MTKDEFINRFASHMVAQVGSAVFDDGTLVETYARDIAESYWDAEDLREDGPEACAEADMLEWCYQ